MRPRRRRPLIERLMSHCREDPATGCWLWTAAIRADGYAGSVSRGTRAEGTVRPHRATYEYFRAEIPPGLCLDHICRVPSCVNPWHLEPVTWGENTRRGLAPLVNGEHNRRKTHCPQGHPYDDNNTRLKRTRDGYTRRVCRTCEGREVSANGR